MNNIGTLIVLTGPSGVGKGTLLRQLTQRHPALYVTVSATTRPPRPGEVEGQDYYFLTREQFQTHIDHDQFLEWAEYAGQFYGTLREPVFAQLQLGRRVILEIELQGARQVRQRMPEAFLIFICPPTWADLEKRIRGRGQDSEQAIRRRLEQAKLELAAAEEFDFQLINDDLETALQALATKILSL
ncbi:MAG: guanylate kinase [Acaryochloridaceae cyanobacterium SU_2_1]|nr:guanylate kinase [Acaryochloridaceae cyanobacterium SU_2_1]